MTENNLKEVSITVDSSKMRKDLTEQITEKMQMEEKIKQLETEASENEHKIDFYNRESGKGTIGLTPDMREKEMNGRNAEKTFSSHEDLLEWVRVNDKKSYEALKAKTIQGLTENKQYWEWNDTFSKDEKGNERSLIGRTLDRANADLRKRFRG